MRARSGIAILALTLITGGVWLSAETASTAAAPASSTPTQPAWQVAETEHFEIHHLPELASELDRVGLAAEQAYRRISARLSFDLATKVPVVLFAPAGAVTGEEAVAYATSDAVAPPEPHRNRLVLPLPETDAELEVLIRHELTHTLVSEIVAPGVGGPRPPGFPLWVPEGVASYMTAEWSDANNRRIRDLVSSGDVPALSQLTGDGGFADARLNDALGHVAFDYIDERWGSDRIRRFLDALSVAPDVSVYERVFELTPTRFDAAFIQYVERRFRSVVR